ncbi:MAG: preprotein translocase subunit SecG [Candidatus Accumulibacter sp.]|jgi:preprotein translocase subunit SecG|nr:preprotein translocase subunit SecG [Accumulibacter sp.]
MNFLFSIILLVHVISAAAIVGLVLVQHGKGADMGAAFGGGASGSLFGATGSANFLSRSTAVLAVVFFATSLTLAYSASNQTRSFGSIMDAAVQSLPASDSTSAGTEQKAGSEALAPSAPADNEVKADNIPK